MPENFIVPKDTLQVSKVNRVIETLLMRLFFLLLLITCSAAVYGQVIVQGKINDQHAKLPIAYANIGIANSNVGTLSNLDGSFSINIPAKFKADTLVFSALGFVRKAIPLSFILTTKDLIISLSEQTILLEQVAITEKKERNRIFELGNPSFKGGEIETDTMYAGRAIALLIENKAPYLQKDLVFPVYVEKARLRIFRNNLASFRFRMRLNEWDSLTGKPGKDILLKSVVVESAIKNGWLEFDLTHLAIQIQHPFFITFEQILDLKDRTAIADGYREFMQRHPDKLKTDTVEFNGKKEVRKILKGGGIDLPGTFLGIASSKSASDYYTCFVRETSMGEWTKVRGIVAATVSLSNQQRVIAKENLPKPCTDNSAICKANQLCKDFMDNTGLAGIQISVSKDNKNTWSAQYGYADIENRIPVTDSTRFRINSISKSVTSAALMKLVSEGKLDPDAPIQKYAPSFPIKKYPITTRQLAGHLAGIRDYKENDLSDFLQTRHFITATKALTLFKEDSLLFKPNTAFHYTTFGWNLIGAVIEGITHQSYVSYMQTHIWKPMGLTQTCEDDNLLRISNRSKFYDLTGQPNDLGDWSYKYPGGGLLSTTKDLVRFGNEMLNGNWMGANVKAPFFESQVTIDNTPTGYGMGWYTGVDKNGHRIWYHSGDSFSSSSHLIIYPDDHLVIAFLANAQDGAAFNIQQLGELFYK